MTAAVLGYGAKLLMHDGAGLKTAIASYLEIGEITEGPDDEDTVSEVDATSHQSPGRRREFIAGLIEGGSINITCNYLPSDGSQDRTTGLQKVFEDGEVRTFIIVDPGATVGSSVDCLVTSRAKARPVDDIMKISFDLRKTGAEVEAALPA